MNINVATWGRLLKKNINLKNVSEQARTENEQNSGRNCHDKKETQIDTDNTIFPHFGFNIVCGNHGSSMQVCVSCSEMSSLKISFGQQAELHPIFTFIGFKHLKNLSSYYIVIHY